MRTTIDRAAIYERDHGLCGFCGEHVAWRDLHLDHVTPRGLGGATSPENLRVAHARCNTGAAFGIYRERVRRGLRAPRSFPPTGSRIILNFPHDLANRVRELAARERRSLTSQIEVLVEQALDQKAA